MMKRRLGAAVWLLAAALLFLMENNTATAALLLTSILMPAVFVLFAKQAAGNLTGELKAPAGCDSKESFEVNISAVCPVPWIVIDAELKITNLLTGEITEKTVQLSPLKGKARAGESLYADHCGTLKIQLKLAAEDIFGLRKSRPVECGEAFTVAQPRLFESSVTLDGRGLILDSDRYSDTKPGFDPAETFGISEYQPGDSIKQIHWKLSQKSDTVMIRQLGLPISDRLLEFIPPRGDADALDAAVCEYISAAHQLLRSGTGFTAAWKMDGEGKKQYHPIQTDADFAVLRDEILWGQFRV